MQGPGMQAEAMNDRERAATGGRRGRVGRPHSRAGPGEGGRGGPGGRGRDARGACGAHLGLLLRKASLGRDEAQRGGVRVFVDLVEVVLQNFHLVLGGAARGLRRHGPGGAAGRRSGCGEQAERREGRRSGRGRALSARGAVCPLPQS